MVKGMGLFIFILVSHSHPIVHFHDIESSSSLMSTFFNNLWEINTWFFSLFWRSLLNYWKFDRTISYDIDKSRDVKQLQSRLKQETGCWIYLEGRFLYCASIWVLGYHQIFDIHTEIISKFLNHGMMTMQIHMFWSVQQDKTFTSENGH